MNGPSNFDEKYGWRGQQLSIGIGRKCVNPGVNRLLLNLVDNLAGKIQRKVLLLIDQHPSPLQTLSYGGTRLLDLCLLALLQNRGYEGGA